MKCSYITIYMFYLLLSRASVCLCMWEFQKEKNGKKILRDQQRLPKKYRFFRSKHFFQANRFQFIKNHYFSESIFTGVTGEILEEYLDLIVTQNSADHFAGHGFK